LWVRGRAELLRAPALVAIVGTRAPTPYGTSQAQRFARALAAAGVGVVSGLARGIDEAAHSAALEAGGATIAVLGSGVDRPWPGGELAERVAREGALVSELEPGTPARRHHFPRRNRLISGLGDAVLVVEAAFASGSLITARWAADQGRTVLAVPGRVDHPMARGCHRLLREGALLAEDPEDVLRELGLVGPTAASPDGQVADAGPSAEWLAHLRGETLSADELAERSGLPVRDLLAQLVQMELAGRVARGPGGLWRLA
jgi:DNA processing protein